MIRKKSFLATEKLSKAKIEQDIGQYHFNCAFKFKNYL